jgi:hypothetical protein
MKYLGLASVVVLTLSLGMFIPQAGANSPKEEALALKKKEAHALKHSGNYVGPNANSGNHVGADSNRSVPEPGTLLLVGAAFAGLVWWRERQARA